MAKQTKQSRSGTPVQVYITTEQRAELQAMADRNRRPLASELRLAFDFYMANPEVVARWAAVPSKAPSVPQEATGAERQEETREEPKRGRKAGKGV